MPSMLLNNLCGRCGRLHRDERGTISIVTLLVLLVFTMLLVMITNVGRHVDDKLKLQNAADAAAVSGGVILTRGLNGLAHTNHLLCEVFAITAFLREGHQRNAEQQVPDILQAWGLAGADLQAATFEPFPPLGRAIVNRVPLEQQAVTAFGNEQAAAAEQFLPIFEQILAEELIPQFQRTLIETVPSLAMATAGEAVRRHARPRNDVRTDRRRPTSQPGDTPLCILFRSNTQAIGQSTESHPLLRTLPAVDPSPTGSDFGAAGYDQEYFDEALQQRSELANNYLDRWNDQKLSLFDDDARMSRFGGLWRIATRGQLDRLLIQEYPLRNLPFQIRRMIDGTHPKKMREMQRKGRWRQVNGHLDRDYHFVAVVYRRYLEEMGPGLFENPLSKQSDAQAFSQVQIYLPESRYVRKNGQWFHDLPIRDRRSGQVTGYRRVIHADNWPSDWNLDSQNWTTRIMPASLPNLQQILAQSPGSLTASAANLRPGPFGSIPQTTLDDLITH
ncbi:MAG: pilus assembly protein TadG-related protein [Planctomycetaceae bacterium]|nr:pilus assembly protein TadG-related protein [Planctomycetaceae bacterium]